MLLFNDKGLFDLRAKLWGWVQSSKLGSNFFFLNSFKNWKECLLNGLLGAMFIISWRKKESEENFIPLLIY